MIHRQSIDDPYQPTVAVAGFRMRPPDNYYARLDRRLPWPADPLGRDATCLKVLLDLCRRFATIEGANAPFLGVDFEVCGAHEFACFADLLREHRYMVEQLVARSGATLSTSCVFQNLADAQYASTFEPLLLYDENTVDEENHFALQCKCGVDATQADLLLALLPASRRGRRASAMATTGCRARPRERRCRPAATGQPKYAIFSKSLRWT